MPLRASLFFLTAISFAFFIACGGPAERIKETSNIPQTPSPTPGERAISGSFRIEGASSGGLEEYTGSLTVAPKGDNYEFRWSTTKGTRIGTGVQLGSVTAVSFAAIGAGRGCGAVLYKIASDGSMEGRTVRWGEEKFGKENLTRTEGTGFVGKYSVSGTTADNSNYSGDLRIKKDGSGYNFDWNIEKPFVAFGIWKGSYAAASFGGRQCGFALYDIQSNGNLDGNWGGQKDVIFGTETAKRQ